MIYLDYNATTPIDARVLEAMMPYLTTHFGNPSSQHCLGRRAKAAVEEARAEVAALLHCTPQEIIFTSGGTESNNMAIQSGLQLGQERGKHMITSNIEHVAIESPMKQLTRSGVTLSIVKTRTDGIVYPEDVAREMRPSTVFVSIMLANNELGTIQPIAKIKGALGDSSALLHTDASQAVSKMPVDVQELGVDLLTLAGHKMYAPKGIGALYVRQGCALPRWMHGAGHERGKRAGTENVPYIVGLGEAAKISRNQLQEEMQQLRILRDQLHTLLEQAFPGKVRLHGHPEQRICNTLNIGFSGLEGNDLAESLNDLVAFSTSSACHSESRETSRVLRAIQAPKDSATGALRLSVGRMTTEQDVCDAAQHIILSATRLYQSR
ncbi:MAG: cysteine desulfurase family protein [Myxococcota bacterium]